MTQPKKLSFPAGDLFVSWTPSCQTKAPILDTALILTAAEIAAEFERVSKISHTGPPPDLAQIRAGLNKLAV